MATKGTRTTQNNDKIVNNKKKTTEKENTQNVQAGSQLQTQNKLNKKHTTIVYN